MDPSHSSAPTISKEMENENAMSSVRRCAYIRIESIEFIQPFESTNDILVTMSMENKRSKKLVTERFFANNGQPFKKEINGEYQLIYSHNVKSHRDPILRIAVENTRAKTFSRHRSIAAALISMQQVVQHDFDGVLLLYECHVPEKNPIGRIRVQIRSIYLDDQDEEEFGFVNSEDGLEDTLSSDNELQNGFARLSRSIRNIFSSSGGVPPRIDHDAHDDNTAGSPTLPFSTSVSDPCAENLPLPEGKDAPKRPQLPPRMSGRVLSPASGAGSLRGSHAVSDDMDFLPGGVPQEFDSSTEVEFASGEGVRVPNSFHDQLEKLASRTAESGWRPVVFLVHDLGVLKPLFTYLQTCADPEICDAIIQLSPRNCCECLKRLYSAYTDKLGEVDLEGFRVFFFGNDDFAWYLLTAYLSLAAEHPTETINIQFTPLLLTCSLTQLIATQSSSFLQCVTAIHQFVAATSSQAELHAQQIGLNKKGVWANFHVEQLLYSLLNAKYTCKNLPINEVSLQRCSAEMESLFGIPELASLLSNDQGKGLKLKIPFLSDISVGIPLLFSPAQYSFLLEVAQKRGYLAVLPDLLSQLHLAFDSMEVRGSLDYWVIDEEGKQCTLESHMSMKNVVMQRLAGQGLEEGETGFEMAVVTARADVTKKLKKTLTKYHLTEKEATGTDGMAQFVCAVNKMMMSLEESQSIYVDGVCFHGVVFMTVSNHYFSRRKSFPVCIPFTDSVEWSV